MTLRIDHAVAAGPATILLHGWLSVAEVDEFERTVVEAGVPLRIDVGQLVGADAAGLRALRRQRERGAHLTGASPYVELLLKSLAGADEGEPEK